MSRQHKKKPDGATKASTPVNGTPVEKKVEGQETAPGNKSAPQQKTVSEHYKKPLSAAALQKKQEKERKAKEKQLYGYRITMDGNEMLTRGQELLASREFIFVSLDLEMWELDSIKITEIGVAVLDMTNQKSAWMPNIDTFHIIPAESLKFLNGRRIADKRKLFSQGKTVVMPEKECRSFWGDLVDKLVSRSRNVYFVGQSVKDDLYCLSKNGYQFNRTLPVLDTQLIWQATSNLPASLVSMLKHLRIPHSFLHNAGNDAYFTMRVLLMILDPSVRERFGLDVGPSAAEAARIAYQHLKGNDKDPDAIPIALTPEEEAIKKEREEFAKLPHAERQKILQKRKQQRDHERLLQTREDLPGRMLNKSPTDYLAEYFSDIKI